MYKRLFPICLILLGLISNISHAQRSIGKVNTNNKENIADKNIIDIPVNLWMDQQFIFLEKPKKLQKFGFDLHLSNKIYSFCTPSNLETRVTCNLKYDKFVGNIIKVINIGNQITDNIITFVEEKTNRKIYAKPFNGQIGGIALVDDLNKAKKKWLGKTIYSKRKNISTYDDNLDKYGTVNIKIGDPLKVIDIWRGSDNIRPLWIIVETQKGEKGFIATAFSWTNIYASWWTERRPWEDYFFDINPHEKYRWSDEIWTLLNDGKVQLGMTQEQVRISWIKPNKINKDIYEGSVREQWIYDSQYLYFVDGKLTSMQNR